jgi:hypothetical protein
MNTKTNNTHGIFIERNLYRSQAFKRLSKSATVILFEFLGRRRLEHKGGSWVITNNGKITLSYREVEKLFGFAPSTMANSITQLVESGFITIAHQGIRNSKDPSRYAISERWRDYGTDKFVEQTRQKDTRKLGFACPKRKKETTGMNSGSLSKRIVIPLSKRIAIP